MGNKDFNAVCEYLMNQNEHSFCKNLQPTGGCHIIATCKYSSDFRFIS